MSMMTDTANYIIVGKRRGLQTEAATPIAKKVPLSKPETFEILRIVVEYSENSLPPK